MHTPARLTLVAAAIAMMTACGGGGGDDAPVDPGPPVTPTTTPLAVRVMDGVLQNALVCLDANANNACDAGEVQGRSGADGTLTLAVPNAEFGKHPVLAMVGTDAVDADSGAVATAYLLKAPADRAGVLSPWTTLVQQQVATMGLSTAEAEALVRNQTGLLVSPLADYSAARSGDPHSARASRAARLLVMAMQQQLQALLPLAGQPDAGGTAMDAAGIHATVHANLLTAARTALVRASRAAMTEACADPTASACRTALAEAATLAVDESQLQPATLPQLAEVQRLVAAAAAATGPAQAQQAGFTLDWVNVGDANNWYYRAQVMPASGATPDANGLYTTFDQRRSRVNGTDYAYSWVGDPARQGDTHWTGSTWEACTVASPSKLTAPDAGGLSRVDNCTGFNAAALRLVPVDIAGRPMADVLARIGATRAGSPPWGAAPSWYSGSSSASVGTAVFPAGAKLVHRVYADLENAIVYDPRSGNELSVWSAAVAAGGDARNGVAQPCAATANQSAAPADSLETVIARNRGTPCVVEPTSVVVDGNQISSPVPNEWWGQSTLAFGTWGSAPVGATPRTAYATANTLFRVAFTGEGQVSYYNCQQRWNDGSVRNCKLMSTGSYTITTLGDARVLTLGDAPEVVSGLLGYQRLYVERGGKVYYGWRNMLGSGYVPRLNDVAGNALLTQLGVPAVTVP